MRYHRFGNLDWEVSALGLSLAGLPVEAAGAEADAAAGATAAAGRTPGVVPGAAAPGRIPSGAVAPLAAAPAADPVALVRHAIDHGVNYLDLGYPYDLGRQRRVAEVAGRALQAGYRERVRLCVTVPVSAACSADGFDRYLDSQLEWLGTDRADFCALSTIDRDNWPAVGGRGLLEQAERALAAGRIGNLGFAFHDHYHILKQVLGDYDRWTFAQFEYSYMDVAHDPGSEGLALAAAEGVAVVVTEPLKRGRLAKDPPETVRRLWAAAPREWPPAEWALRFVWNHPAVSTVVCRVGGSEELALALAVAGDAEAGALTVRDGLTVNRVRAAYQERWAIGCASCRPCLPCPEGIDIPRIFEIYNDAVMFDDVETASRIYREEGHHAGDCTGCGLCESRCAKAPPLPIVDLLEKAGDLLEAGTDSPVDRSRGERIQPAG